MMVAVTAPPRPTTIAELLERYDGLLLDAYGVLVDGSGALPGAAQLLTELERRGTPYAIVTNDASRSQTTYVQRFAGIGLHVRDDQRIVTSGSLLPRYFRDRGLAAQPQKRLLNHVPAPLQIAGDLGCISHQWSFESLNDGNQPIRVFLHVSVANSVA